MTNPDQIIADRIRNWFSLRLGYAYLDPHGRILQVNSLMEGLLENHGDDVGSKIEGSHISDYLIEIIGLEDELDAVLNGERTGVEIPAVNRMQDDGTIRYFNFHVMQADEQNPGHGLLILAEEVTDRVSSQQQLVQERNQLRLVQGELARSNAKLQKLNHFQRLFLSIAAHDMRTPLTVILGYVSQLFVMGRNAKQDDGEFSISGEMLERSLFTIKDQSQWLNRLVDDVLDHHTIEQGRLQLNRQPYDLRTVGDDVLEAFEIQLMQSPKAIQVEKPDKPIVISADPGRIRQIVLNLVGNSFKFVRFDGGWVRIEISVDREAQEAILIVRDNGPGISEEDQVYLFDLFFQAAEGRKAQGVGLGLYIVNSLVEAHNAKIRVDSTVGEGTAFRIAFPLLEIPS